MGIGKTKQGKVKRFKGQKELEKKKKDNCNDCTCEEEEDASISNIPSCGDGGAIENGVKNLSLAQEASDLF